MLLALKAFVVPLIVACAMFMESVDANVIVTALPAMARDFGHDPDALREQVVRTVRHELAHHLGWDEKGVRGLGL